MHFIMQLEKSYHNRVKSAIAICNTSKKQYWTDFARDIDNNIMIITFDIFPTVNINIGLIV